MLIDEGLELLHEAEARALLLDGEVGRVGVSIGALPAIFPVNYRMIDGCIVFRTSEGTKLAAAMRNTVVAFEVDDWDRAGRTGWSVLVIGRASVVHDLDTTLEVLHHGPEPFAAGPRTRIVRIRPQLVTGRRIIGAS